MEDKNKLYVLIDKKLDPIYGAVQGGHAVAEWMLYQWERTDKGGDHDVHWKWENDYLIYLAVDVDYWEALLRHNGVDGYVEFDEPDLDYKTTAIAVWEGHLPEHIKHKIEREQLLK